MRRSVNKRRGARSFRKDLGKTRAINVVQKPGRGGYRL